MFKKAISKGFACYALTLGLSPLTIAIAQANQVPEVRGHSEQVAAGKVNASWIWARDAEGDHITYAITTQPKYGTIELDWNTGRYQYRPTAAAKGNQDQFQYRATDGKGWSEPATVNLTLLPQDGSAGNRAPEAVSWTLQINAAHEYEATLWGRDADNDPMTFAIIDYPRQGSLKLDAKTGRISYRAYRDQAGRDSFSYQVSDSRHAHSGITQMQLELRGSATPPPVTPPVKPPVTPPVNPPVTPPVNPPVTPNDPVLDPSLRSKADFSPMVHEVLQNEFFVEHFDHAKAGRLEAVLAAIDFLARQQQIDDPDLNKLLYYVRAYNYYLGFSKATAAQAKMLEQALFQVANMSELLVYQAASGQVIEGYVVGLGALMSSAESSAGIVRHLPRLLQLLQHLDSTAQLNKKSSYGDAVFQVLNLFDRFGWAEGALRSALVADRRFPEAIAQLGSGRNSMWRNDDGFIVMNAIEALGKMARLSDGAWREATDKGGRRVMQAHLGQGQLDDQELKSNFRSYYVDYAYRADVDGACSSLFSGLCYKFEIADVLPQTHTCSNSLKVRAQPMTQAQMTGICQSLGKQEQDFHRIMQTNWQPVADDLNEALELVIFSSREQYQKFGGLLYGFSTDNGGMYLEGSPWVAGNQARFFAYVQPTPSWQVWNLNHEYVHYLDGRFNQYGSFGHYPLNLTTWWAEGLAEYLAWGSHFERGMNDISRVAPGQRPSLDAITKLSYESGSSMVYHWSYTLHRYLQERDPARHLALAAHLRRNDINAYSRALSELGQVHGSQYPQWRDQLLESWSQRPRSAADMRLSTEAANSPVAPEHASARQRQLDPRASLARPPRD
jgi:hypothetical protein